MITGNCALSGVLLFSSGLALFLHVSLGNAEAEPPGEADSMRTCCPQSDPRMSTCAVPEPHPLRATQIDLSVLRV